MHQEAEETFAYLTFPKVKPEKVIGDFLESKLNERVLKKYPEWDLPRIDPKVNIVSATRDFYNSELRLSEKRLEAAGRRKYLVEEWQKLETEQEKFKQSFKDFDRMIEENARKTQRAITKRKESARVSSNADAKIKQLKLDYDKLIAVKELMETKLKEHCIYETYLRSVVQSKPDEFSNPQDVFNKFASLYETKNSLSERLKKNIIETENVKDKLEQQTIKQNTKLIGLSNRIALLHTRYQEAKDRSCKYEEIVHSVRERLRDKYLELLTVKQTCWNVYVDMCEHRRAKPSIPRHDFEQQLLYIKKFFKNLQVTIPKARNALQADASSEVAENQSKVKVTLLKNN
ncbi:hypothetical protein FQR65_LT13321 [Abscondita terminalis]|nr:hypothetical protein FQR65_LT13321 [Abscondita terminalis]